MSLVLAWQGRWSRRVEPASSAVRSRCVRATTPPLPNSTYFFGGVELVLAEVSAAVIDRATDLRAKYNLKTPDAIHYATAIEVGALAFLTGDRALARCSEVLVEVL